MKEYETLLQNQPVDVSEQFGSQHNHYFPQPLPRAPPTEPWECGEEFTEK